MCRKVAIDTLANLVNITEMDNAKPPNPNRAHLATLSGADWVIVSDSVRTALLPWRGSQFRFGAKVCPLLGSARAFYFLLHISITQRNFIRKLTGFRAKSPYVRKSPLRNFDWNVGLFDPVAEMG